MSTATYNITPQQKLIDLNGDMTNFKLTFTATSSEPFYVLVVDQKMLDDNVPLNYKKVELSADGKSASIGGDIVVDKNIYQNFYLLLKSDNPCDVTVNITKEQIPPNIPPPQNTSPPLLTKPPSNGGNNWKTILILIALGLAGFLLWQYFSKRSQNTELSNPVASNNPSPVPSVGSAASRTNSVASSSHSMAFNGNSDLLSRLNSLAM